MQQLVFAPAPKKALFQKTGFGVSVGCGWDVGVMNKKVKSGSKVILNIRTLKTTALLFLRLFRSVCILLGFQRDYHGLSDKPA
jgi:hypothetical protein